MAEPQRLGGSALFSDPESHQLLQLWGRPEPHVGPASLGTGQGAPAGACESSLCGRWRLHEGSVCSGKAKGLGEPRACPQPLRGRGLAAQGRAADRLGLGGGLVSESQAVASPRGRIGVEGSLSNPTAEGPSEELSPRAAAAILGAEPAGDSALCLPGMCHTEREAHSWSDCHPGVTAQSCPSPPLSYPLGQCQAGVPPARRERRFVGGTSWGLPYEPWCPWSRQLRGEGVGGSHW